MLGERTATESRRKTYLNIKDGAIVRRNSNGEEERFSFVEGRLQGITQRERNFRGETVVYWYIDLMDEAGELYSIGSPYGSNTYKSIILQLASFEGLEAVKRGSTVKIEPYLKNDFTKVQVYADGERLSWATRELPPIEEATIGGRKVKDDSKRMELIISLTETIREALRLRGASEDFSNINS